MILAVDEGGDGAGGDVALVGGDHFVVDFDEEGSDESDDGFGVGEDLDDVGASFEFAVESFDGVVRPDLGPVSGRERRVREQVVFGGFELGGDLGCDGFELVDHRAQLGAGAVGVWLSEDRSDQRGDDLAVLMVGDRQHVAHGVHTASLPASSLEHPPDRGFETGVSIRDDQLDAAEVAFDETAEELGPKRFVLPNHQHQHRGLPYSHQLVGPSRSPRLWK